MLDLGDFLFEVFLAALIRIWVFLAVLYLFVGRVLIEFIVAIIMISVKIECLLGMLTIKLNDDNFIKWSYQFCSVLRGYDILGHFTGDSVCPPKFVLTPELGVTKQINDSYKEWIKTDMTLLSLLIATLSDDAIEHVVGCKTACEAWTALQDKYMFVF